MVAGWLRRGVMVVLDGSGGVVGSHRWLMVSEWAVGRSVDYGTTGGCFGILFDSRGVAAGFWWCLLVFRSACEDAKRGFQSSQRHRGCLLMLVLAIDGDELQWTVWYVGCEQWVLGSSLLGVGDCRL